MMASYCRYLRSVLNNLGVEEKNEWGLGDWGRVWCELEGSGKRGGGLFMFWSLQ